MKKLDEVNECIITFLESLQPDFPFAKAIYAYDKILKYHIVEFEQEFLKEDEKFCSKYMDFIFEFNEKFPNINIHLTWKDIDNDMTNVKYKLTPKKIDLTAFSFEKGLEILVEESEYFRFKKPNSKSFNNNLLTAY